MTPDTFHTRGRFAVDHPDCLHSPEIYREIIGELLTENVRAREINGVLLAECKWLRAMERADSRAAHTAGSA